MLGDENMKKTMMILLTLLLLLTGGCSGKNNNGDTGKVDDTPASQPAEFIKPSENFSELVKALNGKALYERSDFFKQDFTNPSAIGYVRTSDYAYKKFTVTEKEMTIGEDVYPLTGEIKMLDGGNCFRIEAENATIFLQKDKNGYWGLYCCDKGTLSVTGIPYALTNQVTYWHGVEAENKGFFDQKEEIGVEKINDNIRVSYKYWFAVDKAFYDSLIYSNTFDSTLVMKIEKSAENYDVTVTYDPASGTASLTYGGVSKYGSSVGYISLGASICPIYSVAASVSYGPVQYEENGKIWFLVCEDDVDYFFADEIKDKPVSHKMTRKKITVSDYMNHFFLPKDYK